MIRKIELLLGVALAAMSASGLAASGQPVDPGSRPATHAAFAPPAGPVRLTRELRRQMSGGREIVARRSYEIRFHRDGRGWRVDGTLMQSEVEAPGVAPQLLELERRRKDEGLFPLLLDASGRIVVQNGSSDPATERSLASAAADVLSGTPLAEPDRRAALAVASSLYAQARAAGGNWPVDLFVPEPGQRVETRTIQLAEGAAGKVTITISAADGPTGLVERFERRIVTETAGNSRQSVETWTLALAR